MKVFACERQKSYSGGLILVAAPTKEEAFDLFVHDERFDWMIDVHSADEEWRDKDDKDAIISTDYYPLEKWFEIECLNAEVSEPQVIVENGYSE